MNLEPIWVVGCGLWVVGCGLWGIVAEHTANTASQDTKAKSKKHLSQHLRNTKLDFKTLFCFVLCCGPPLHRPQHRETAVGRDTYMTTPVHGRRRRESECGMRKDHTASKSADDVTLRLFALRHQSGQLTFTSFPSSTSTCLYFAGSCVCQQKP